MISVQNFKCSITTFITYSHHAGSWVEISHSHNVAHLHSTKYINTVTNFSMKFRQRKFDRPPSKGTNIAATFKVHKIFMLILLMKRNYEVRFN